jgi:hypothetical protein
MVYIGENMFAKNSFQVTAADVFLEIQLRILRVLKNTKQLLSIAARVVVFIAVAASVFTNFYQYHQAEEMRALLVAKNNSISELQIEQQKQVEIIASLVAANSSLVAANATLSQKLDDALIPQSSVGQLVREGVWDPVANAGKRLWSWVNASN